MEILVNLYNYNCIHKKCKAFQMIDVSLVSQLLQLLLLSLLHLLLLLLLLLPFQLLILLQLLPLLQTLLLLQLLQLLLLILILLSQPLPCFLYNLLCNALLTDIPIIMCYVTHYIGYFCNPMDFF